MNLSMTSLALGAQWTVRLGLSGRSLPIEDAARIPGLVASRRLVHDVINGLAAHRMQEEVNEELARKAEADKAALAAVLTKAA